MALSAAPRGRRRAVLALALVALLALGAPGWARAEDDDDGVESTTDDSAATETAAPPPPPPPPPRRAGAKLAFTGEAAAYAGDATESVPSSATKAAPGKPLLSGAVSKVAAGASLSVAFQTTLGGKSAAPQQAVLRLSAEGAPSAYVWARRRKGGEPGDLVVTVTHAEVERQIGRVPSALAATLLVGDPAAAPQPQGAEWALGEVRFAEAAAAAAAASEGGSKAATTASKKQPKLLTALHQPLHNAAADIRHTFRRPERRAPAPVALAFTGLALLPLVALFPALAAAGANLKGWPSSSSADPSAGAWATAFLASLAAVLLLLVVFWLRLTLATVLWPGVALGSALWYTGWRALRAHASARLAEEGAGAKKKE